MTKNDQPHIRLPQQFADVIGKNSATGQRLKEENACLEPRTVSQDPTLKPKVCEKSPTKTTRGKR
jgi:hypothetical protein